MLKTTAPLASFHVFDLVSHSVSIFQTTYDIYWFDGVCHYRALYGCQGIGNARAQLAQVGVDGWRRRDSRGLFILFPVASLDAVSTGVVQGLARRVLAEDATAVEYCI